MNKQNVKTWQEDGRLHGEWADRSLDDDDRYADDAVIITADVPAEGGEKALMAALYNKFDEWIEATR